MKAKTNQNLYDFLMQNNISSFREQMFNQCASCTNGRGKLAFLSWKICIAGCDLELGQCC